MGVVGAIYSFKFRSFRLVGFVPPKVVFQLLSYRPVPDFVPFLKIEKRVIFNDSDTFFAFFASFG